MVLVYPPCGSGRAFATQLQGWEGSFDSLFSCVSNLGQVIISNSTQHGAPVRLLRLMRFLDGVAFALKLRRFAFPFQLA